MFMYIIMLHAIDQLFSTTSLNIGLDTCFLTKFAFSGKDVRRITISNFCTYLCQVTLTWYYPHQGSFSEMEQEDLLLYMLFQL